MNETHLQEMSFAVISENGDKVQKIRSTLLECKDFDSYVIKYESISELLRGVIENGIEFVLIDVESKFFTQETIMSLSYFRNGSMIIATADEKNEEDVVNAFKWGCDDFIYDGNMFELCYRLKAMCARSFNKIQMVYKYKNLTVKKDRRVTDLEGSSVELTKIEYSLLVMMLNNRKKQLTREALRDALWDGDKVKNCTVNVTIYRLKQKLKPLCPEFEIKTLRGAGYMLV